MVSPVNGLVSIKALSDRVMQARQELTWILAGQLLALAGGVVSIKVLTNIIGPKEYGLLALGLTVAGVLNMYVYGPAANVVARFFAVYREKRELEVYFHVLKRFHRTFALGLSIISFAAGTLVGFGVGREWAAIIVLSLLFGIVSGVNASYLNLFNAIRQRKVVALHQGTDVWLRIGLAVAFLYLCRNSSQYALLGFLVGTTLVTASQATFAMRNADIRNHWKENPVDMQATMRCSREFLGYATPFTVFAGFGAISMFADRWIIQGLFGEGQVGIYSAIYSIANAPIALLFAIASQMMVPIIFERAGTMTTMSQAESSAGLLRLTVAVSTAIVLAATAVAYLLSEPLVRIFTNATFAVHHSVLWVSVLGISLFHIGQLLSLKGLYFNLPKIYLWPKGLQAGSFLILAYLLGKGFGIMGVASAVCVSSILYLGMVLFVNGRISNPVFDANTKDTGT